MEITTSTSIEDSDDGKYSKIWVTTTVDGAAYRHLHVSGNSWDAHAYFDGNISFTELLSRWSIRHG